MCLTENRKLLLEVVKDALWNTDVTFPVLSSLNEQQVVGLLAEAEKQTVHGLVLDVVGKQKYPFAKNFVYEHTGLMTQTMAQNEHINHVLVEFAKVMDDQRIDYVVVKGQSVGCCYPKPQLRSSGDIDFYCSPENFVKAKHTLPQVIGIAFEGEDSEHHLSFDWQDVRFEMHFSLFDFYEMQKNKTWCNLLNHSEADTFGLMGYDIKTLPATLHTFYIFLHLYEHLLELGVGLRQFCDFAILLHHRKDEIDDKAFQKYAEVFGMTKAVKACGYILVHHLGLPAMDFPFTLTGKDGKRAKRALGVVFYRGNMGKYNKRGGFSGYKHNLEATGIKLSHFVKFAPLSPSFCIRWIGHEIPKKLMMKTNNVLKGIWKFSKYIFVPQWGKHKEAK